MSRKIFISIAVLAISRMFVCGQQPLLNLMFEENYTPTYAEIIEMYQTLDARFENAALVEQGGTDSGKPLHLFVINNKKEFDPAKIKQSGKSVLLINNGIHAGEPEGIDASLWFADDILRNKDGLGKILENTVIIIIPVYSIGGVLNRSAYNRSGQTTPYETGFRGNAANLDLNRDFTKNDSENARSFARLFRDWAPDVFLDTHTTNGSDHQYSITYIPPEPALFPPAMGQYLRQKLIPSMYSQMKKGDCELIPYVNYIFNDPKQGISMSHEGPRYSSGFASMFHSFGMMTENQIYKPFPDRVKSCYQFICMLAKFTSENSRAIKDSREEGIRQSMALEEYPIVFELDTSKYQMIEFKGYEAETNQISPLTGLKRFGYDTAKPYTETIKYFDTYRPTATVKVPEFYILPQSYREIIERLDLNGISYSRLESDSLIDVSVDYIDTFTSPPQPYNGHYYHDRVVTHSEVQNIRFFAGDLLIPVRQEKIKYLLEMLEPRAVDSFFRWNFFDNILDQREYFSSYGFEPNAIKYLDEHPAFRAKFEEKRKTDLEFAKNHRAQLAYIYNNTEWFEKTWKRYPVGKIYH